MNEHQPRFPLMVVTDLDGTLLDHFSYSFEAAMPALEWLRSLRVPVIFNTSKTYAEVVDIQRAMGVDSACIVENGAAVYLPDSKQLRSIEILPEAPRRVGDKWIKVFGLSRASIVSKLHGLREAKGYLFEGFSDWSAEEVGQVTGLSCHNASLAMLRYFSEPVIWRDSEERYLTFAADIEQSGLMLLRGGRFVHVLGQCNKGASMTWLRCLYAGFRTDTPASLLVALGDSKNDIAMLEAADIAVVVKSPVHPYPAIVRSEGEIIYTSSEGPAGWNEAIINLLGRYGPKE